MADIVRIGIVGDRDRNNPTHDATEEALGHAGASLGVSVRTEWLPTDALEGRASNALRRFDAVFCSPGSPYRNFDGVLEAIHFVRERGVPFIGTCGGFQHAVIEYARNVLCMPNAGHAEYDPNTPDPFISAMSCSPFGRKMEVEIEPGSRVHGVYDARTVVEEYRCNYGLTPGSRRLVEAAGLRVSGTDADGEARIVELPEHPFYVATLFVPQTRSSPESPHPLLVAFVVSGRDAMREKGIPVRTA
ncbi:glutamine amidotransferase [Rubrobacter tropicus]|uniref:CTP synthase (glutamine hydrolyzing) n=1 Tax=Rubrobacter tropicus TaxID=2653851 RepID=A0A6G8QEP0_9ACTN|nr:glutamine amidotransferase [Rubrobacter tropicus]QIN84908.1 glutamine amidotransferase [Rubrobacter tropicus]